METDGIYYFNRCRRCLGLLTKLDIKKTLETGGELCACGSTMFSPSNVLWKDWLQPRVWKMAVYQILGLLAPQPNDGVAPPIPKTIFASVPALSPDEIRAPEEGE